MRISIPTTSYYRRSASLPLIVTLLSVLLWLLTRNVAEQPGLVRAAQVLAIVHAYAIVPYTLLLAIGLVRFRNEDSVKVLRRVMWTFPVALAFSVTTFILIAESIERRGMSSGSKAAVWGVGAALVGLGYVVVIEAGLVVARRLRLVTP